MPEPVAIVGMGCRWPGGVQSPLQFWEFLRGRRDGGADLGQHRYSADGFYHPNPERPGTMAQRGAFLLSEDVRLFDHSFVGISSLEAETMDPGQSKLLEVAYEALESAGQSFESAVWQPACTALQIGIVDLLAPWSVFPTVVAGHSSGEMAAAYAAGRLTAAEAIVSAYCRGLVLTQNRQSGSMLAVGLGLEAATSVYLRGHEDRVRVAAINSPGSVTLSGDTEAIEQISAALTESGVFNRLLKTGGNAYHSYHMAAIGQSYEDMINEGLSLIHGRNLCHREHRYQPIAWVLSVAPAKCHGELDTKGWAPYWRANLESCVRFSEAAATMTAAPNEPVHCFVEIRAHGALKGPLNQIAQSTGRSVSYVAAMVRHRDGLESVLNLAGNLFCLDYRRIDLAAVNAVDAQDGSGLQHGSIAVDLLPYRYAYGPVRYHESRLSKEYCFRNVIRHDPLGSKVPGSAERQPLWRNILRKKDLPWLEQYSVQKALGLIAMAVEAEIRSHRQSSVEMAITGYELRDIQIKSLLSIPEDDYGVEQAWVLFTGPMFQTISNIYSHHVGDVVEATINLNSTSGVVRGGESQYPMHPTALEGALMLSFIASHRGCPERVKGSFAPSRISHLYLKTGSQQASATVITNRRAARRTGGESAKDLQIRLDVEGFTWESHKDGTIGTFEKSRPLPARLIWKPDICLLSNHQAREMFPPAAGKR
ncbi:hypothetical protein PG993_003648 [Apiospora rasikravindrae]|uniref:Polyketide synthase n=1 Tax=Apiospora rasikravindrae TaxID=990691 RepID=A0ABR1U2U5_9PEZI